MKFLKEWHKWLRETPKRHFVSAALLTTLMGTSGVYVCIKISHWRVRTSPHYKEALEIIARHDRAKESLGTPIEVGLINLGDRQNNYTTNTDSHFRIPLSGKLDAGFVNVLAKRASKEDSFRTERVKLELEKSGNFLIYQAPAINTDGDD